MHAVASVLQSALLLIQRKTPQPVKPAAGRKHARTPLSARCGRWIRACSFLHPYLQVSCDTVLDRGYQVAKVGFLQWPKHVHDLTTGHRGRANSSAQDLLGNAASAWVLPKVLIDILPAYKRMRSHSTVGGRVLMSTLGAC